VTDGGRLQGKVAIVTGATEGIGLAVTRLFAREGARLVLVARREEPGRRLLERLGSENAVFVAGDVADPATAEQAVSEAHEHHGGLDVLVNNAGIDLSGPALLETTMADARRVFDVNLFGALWMLQEAARAMPNGGAIVNVTSRAALIGLPGSAVYGASKGALESLTRAAALEFVPLGVRVNSVAPGLTDTPMIRTWFDAHPDPDAFRARRLATIPQGRLAAPESVAASILHLASDESASVTGVCLPVDGGYTAG
jgi:NAD(P)-dependent dehydrogenase (short-subunit alcohol dehydrogenase family)